MNNFDVAPKLKMRLNLQEAARFLGVPEGDVRLWVRQGVLEPEKYDGLTATQKRMVHLRRQLYFNRSDLLLQWEKYQKQNGDLRSEISYLSHAISDLAMIVQEMKEQLHKPPVLGTADLAKALGLHEVTIRKHIKRSEDGLRGILKIKGIKPIKLRKVGKNWRIAPESLEIMY